MPLPERSERRPLIRRPAPNPAPGVFTFERLGPVQEQLNSVYSSRYDVGHMNLPAAFDLYIRREFRDDPNCPVSFSQHASSYLKGNNR